MTAASPTRSQADVLRILFRALTDEGVRYCVLHSYDGRTELSSDLDLVVHLHDTGKLSGVIRALAAEGYQWIHRINYAVNANYLVFAWWSEGALKSISIDIISEHRRANLMLANTDSLLQQRRERDGVWVSAPAVEFSYLLAKEILKGVLDERRELRLRALAAAVGDAEALRVAAALFGASRARAVVDACRAANLRALAPSLERHLRRSQPVATLAAICRDRVRLVRRWLRPTGLFVALLGPDGAGKSTLVNSLLAQPAGFRRFRVFHWRPMALWHRQQDHAADRPHNQRVRPAWSSMLRLVAHFIDYWVGYWTIVRPAIARTGLVVFDRYFDDVIADPVRYRYGGPKWWPRLLRRMTPRPDVMLILDASEDVLLSRKQECEPDQIRTQRRLTANWRTIQRVYT